MDERFLRNRTLLGEEINAKISNLRIAIFGLGGVGGYALEALVRSGINHFLILDKDSVDITNINRQIIATSLSVDKSKCQEWKERILSINPLCEVEILEVFYDASVDIDFTQYDYVIDCIDTITSKLILIERCKENNVKIISSMGAGNRLDPTLVRVDDIYKTDIDPLARVMRRELRKRNIKSLPVAYSLETPLKPNKNIDSKDLRKNIPSSMVFAPAAMGMALASYVIKDLLKNE